jgi:hypothetical protein
MALNLPLPSVRTLIVNSEALESGAARSKSAPKSYELVTASVPGVEHDDARGLDAQDPAVPALPRVLEEEGWLRLHRRGVARVIRPQRGRSGRRDPLAPTILPGLAARLSIAGDREDGRRLRIPLSFHWRLVDFH